MHVFNPRKCVLTYGCKFRDHVMYNLTQCRKLGLSCMKRKSSQLAQCCAVDGVRACVHSTLTLREHGVRWGEHLVQGNTFSAATPVSLCVFPSLPVLPDKQVRVEKWDVDFAPLCIRRKLIPILTAFSRRIFLCR